jgi:thioredoxin reductase (NADPH)
MLDLVIIGVGPAGLTASIYASRYKLKNLVIGEVLAGELSKASRIENLPGFVSVSGLEWGEKTKEQVEKLGAKVVFSRVGRIEKKGKGFKVYTESEEQYQTKSLIVATGSERRKLNILGEKEYVGKGVSFCTTCDIPFFRDKVVAMIGGSDAAVSGAVHGAEFAKKVYIIYRREKLRAEPIWLEEWQKIEKKGKGETIYKTNITKILGDGNEVTGVKLDSPYQEKKTLPLDGVFIEIGGVPASSLLKPLDVKMTRTDYVRVNEVMETNIPGLYAAGDITDKSVVLVQAITAMTQGAIAAASAYKYLKGEKAPQILGV